MILSISSDTQKGFSTFRSHLLLQYEKLAVSTIASDEEDAKQLAKRKMLGNIKFIGELGQLQIIQDSILHRLELQ